MQRKCSLAIADYRKAREMKPDEFLALQAQALAKRRLEQLARRNSCGPGADRRLASGGPRGGSLTDADARFHDAVA
jgi:hypothetical protein